MKKKSSEGTVLRPSPLSRVKRKHPARASDDILLMMAKYLEPGWRVLEPFAGTGRLAEVPWIDPVLVEIERDWATHVCGDATRLPFRDGTFDGAAWSPCYGNRLSDHHVARDASTRRSYTHDIGHDLHSRNAGYMQWGRDYRLLHEVAYLEVIRVVRSGGRLILNIKDFYKDREVVPVSDWHRDLLLDYGLTLLHHDLVRVRSLKYGANSELRVPYENVYCFGKS